MPYVERNEQGSISSLRQSGGSDSEFLPVEHPEVLQFLVASADDAGENVSSIEMLFSDLKLIRVIEDVIDLLIAKGVMAASDIAPAALANINGRRVLRGLAPLG